MKKVKGPLRYIGGKYYLADWHVTLFPKHSLFVSTCAGGLSELFAKPVGNEIVNDEDGELVNFWKVLRDNKQEFQEKCLFTPLSRELIYDLRNLLVPAENRVERAWRFFVLNRQAFSGTGPKQRASWSISRRVRRGINESVSAFLSSVDGLEDVADRLISVGIENDDALNIVYRFDEKDTFFYVDPPYYLGEENGGDEDNAYYSKVFTKERHKQFSDYFRKCCGKFMVCGYDSEYYRTLYEGWRKESRLVAINASAGDYKDSKIECVFLNY